MSCPYSGWLPPHFHPVLLDSVSAATPADLVPALDTTAVRLLDAAVPGVPDAGPHDPRLRLLVPHALALLRRIGGPSAADALAVATRLSIALHRTGDYLSAWETARNAADPARQLLSRTRAALGHMEEGSALMTDVVERRERGLGPEHPFTVASRHLLDAYRSGRRRP
ncbi:hypothetical protein [Streptomyces sp. NPDC087787]|uniref:hypothetical protein n=1 Tax=Streptomyces sp. NPDC087787 TaxID=3365803 RepID=UPI00381B2605